MAQTEQEKKRQVVVPRSAVSEDAIRTLMPPNTPDILIKKLVEMRDPKKIQEVATAMRLFGGSHGQTMGGLTPSDQFVAIILGKVGEGTKLNPPKLEELQPQSPINKQVYKLLENPEMADAFIKEPVQYSYYIWKMMGAMGRSTKDDGHAATQDNMIRAFASLATPEIAVLFAKHPSTFLIITNAAGIDTGEVFRQLQSGGKVVKGYKTVAQLFDDHAHEFGKIARQNREDVAYAFGLFKDETYATIMDQNPGIAIGMVKCSPKEREEIIKAFKKAKEFDHQTIIAPISRHDHIAVEVGRRLDDLHEMPKERAAFLQRLTSTEVVALLCSDPSLFFTSSNHMMFDRIKKEIGEGGLTTLKEKYGLTDEQMRNLIFRSVGYGRLGDLISTDRKELDVRAAIDIIRGDPTKKTGMYAERYDSEYFYLMANGIEALKKFSPQIVEDIEKRYTKLQGLATKTLDQEKILAALVYVRYMFTKEPKDDPLLNEIAAGSKFDRKQFVGPDGKLTVLQVFDKDDTEKDHYPATKEYFSKMFGQPPKKGKSGELIFENSTSRVILYMGISGEQNQEFVDRWTDQYPKGVITFRGHSFSLMENMPSGVFGNKKGKYVFIPGSCGSAGSVPEYITQNPDTMLRFFSNTSTGRGAVTNIIVELLLTQLTPVDFPDILKRGAKRIEAAEGSIDSIRIRQPGESVIEYVIAATAAKKTPPG